MRQSKRSRKMTPAQREANQRSFRIFRLRGVYYQCLSLTGWRCRIAQLCVDAELLLLGVETEGGRRRALEEEWARLDRQSAAEFEEIPF